MNSPKYEKLQEIAQPVAEYLLPEIEQSVEICVKSYWDDPTFNDQWIFGTHLWKNAWNRFEAASSFNDCPFEVCGKGNEYKLRIGKFVVRHHRIDQQTKLPSSAKAVKSAADAIQMMLFDDEWCAPVEIDNIIIAIDADVDSGLKEVFVGELMPHSKLSKQYRWVQKAPVYLAEGVKSSDSGIIQVTDKTNFKQFAPVEETPEISVTLDNSRHGQKDAESDGTK